MPMEDWKLEEYQNMYKLILNRMLVPDPNHAGAYMYPLPIEEEEEEEEEEEDPCEVCIVCVEKYDYKNTGRMCLIHDPRDLRGEEE